MATPTPAASAAPDLWHGYGLLRAAEDHAIPDRLYWNWYQDTPPGAELLGDVTGRVLADLGAGAGRQAAHLAHTLEPSRVIAIDNSPAQHARTRALYGHLPRLDPVQADATAYLRGHPGIIDACYSIFGALDFTDPRDLLPAVATALRPGGRLTFSTLAHYRSGRAPESEPRPARIPARLPDGTATTMDRWVLDVPVWEKLLTEAGFGDITLWTLRDPGNDARPSMTTNVFRVIKPA